MPLVAWAVTHVAKLGMPPDTVKRDQAKASAHQASQLALAQTIVYPARSGLSIGGTCGGLRTGRP